MEVYILHAIAIKVITHKSRGEVSLVEEDTIDYVSTAYLEPKNFFKPNSIFFIKKILYDFLVQTVQRSNAHDQPNFIFSVLPTGPKPAQISIYVPSKLLTIQLMYNDFDCNCNGSVISTLIFLKRNLL
jgi:hypothetical protein